MGELGMLQRQEDACASPEDGFSVPTKATIASGQKSFQAEKNAGPVEHHQRRG